MTEKYTPEEIAKMEESRTVRSAELIEDGATYVADNEGPRLEVTPQQLFELWHEMQTDLDSRTADDQPAVAQEPAAPEAAPEPQSEAVREPDPTPVDPAEKQTGSAKSTARPENGREKRERKPWTEIRTSQGSVYKRLPDGRTQRTRKDGKQSEPQDLLVFIPPWKLIEGKVPEQYANIFETVKDEQEYNELLAYYGRAKDTSVYPIGLVGDKVSRLYDNAEVAEVKKAGGRIFLVLEDTKAGESFTLPAEDEPGLGYMTFDTRRFEQDGKTLRQRHVGHPVTHITAEYKG